MTAQVPVGHVPTLYARTGDLFAWLCVVALVVALGIAAVAPGKVAVRVIKDRTPFHSQIEPRKS
jgi:hypothetical protein